MTIIKPNNRINTFKKKIILFLFIFSITGILVFQGCENNPNDLGIDYLPNTDTTGVKFLDSETDSMTITSNNYLKYINTVYSTNILVGNYENYNSKALLKFYSISGNYDSAEVISAVLTLKYGNYYFKDKLGLTDFSVHRVVTNLNYNTITYDSVMSSDFGIKTIGSFSSVVADSTSISVNLDNNVVKDWLEYAADTSYPVKNYGIAFLPNMSSSTIKGFNVINDDVNFVPTVNVKFIKNGTIDSVKINASVGVTLSNVVSPAIPPDRFLLQNGIAYENILNFDLTKLPSNVIINNATLQFTLDNSNSFYPDGSNKKIIIGMVIDSAMKTDSIFADAVLVDSVLYSVALNRDFQRWNSGILPNLGLTMKNADIIQNLNYFAIYSPSYPDQSKRPRLKITYTLRR